MMKQNMTKDPAARSRIKLHSSILHVVFAAFLMLGSLFGADVTTVEISKKGELKINGFSIAHDRWFTADIAKYLREIPQSLGEDGREVYNFTRSGIAIMRGGVSFFFKRLMLTTSQSDGGQFIGNITIFGEKVEFDAKILPSLPSIADRLKKVVPLSHRSSDVLLVFELENCELCLVGNDKKELVMMEFYPIFK